MSGAGVLGWWLTAAEGASDVIFSIADTWRRHRARTGTTEQPRARSSRAAWFGSWDTGELTNYWGSENHCLEYRPSLFPGPFPVYPRSPWLTVSLQPHMPDLQQHVGQLPGAHGLVFTAVLFEEDVIIVDAQKTDTCLVHGVTQCCQSFIA
jgi:hypothetical protein